MFLSWQYCHWCYSSWNLCLYFGRKKNDAINLSHSCYLVSNWETFLGHLLGCKAAVGKGRNGTKKTFRRSLPRNCDKKTKGNENIPATEIWPILSLCGCVETQGRPLRHCDITCCPSSRTIARSRPRSCTSQELWPVHFSDCGAVSRKCPCFLTKGIKQETPLLHWFNVSSSELHAEKRIWRHDRSRKQDIITLSSIRHQSGI